MIEDDGMSKREVKFSLKHIKGGHGVLNSVLETNRHRCDTRRKHVTEDTK